MHQASDDLLRLGVLDQLLPGITYPSRSPALFCGGGSRNPQANPVAPNRIVRRGVLWGRQSAEPRGREKRFKRFHRIIFASRLAASPGKSKPRTRISNNSNNNRG